MVRAVRQFEILVGAETDSNVIVPGHATGGIDELLPNQ